MQTGFGSSRNKFSPYLIVHTRVSPPPTVLNVSGGGGTGTSLTASTSASLDTFWSAVILRCTFDTGLIDLSNDNRVLGPQGSDVGVTTVISKFGGYSLYSNGVPDNMVVAQSNSTDTGPSGDFQQFTEFCLEGWVYPVANQLQVAFGQYESETISQRNIHVGLTAAGKLYMRITSNYSNTYVEIQSDTAVSLNTWTHIACTRDSSAIRLFINGVVQSQTLTGWFSVDVSGYLSRLVLAGRRNEVTRFDIWNGYIDDVRFTKGSDGSGAVRYTTTFTPPINALPLG